MMGDGAGISLNPSQERTEREKTFMLWQSSECAWSAVHIDTFSEVRLVIPDDSAETRYKFFFTSRELISVFKNYLNRGLSRVTCPRHAIVKKIYVVPTVEPFYSNGPFKPKRDVPPLNWLDCFSLEEYIQENHDSIYGKYYIA